MPVKPTKQGKTKTGVSKSAAATGQRRRQKKLAIALLAGLLGLLLLSGLLALPNIRGGLYGLFGITQTPPPLSTVPMEMGGAEAAPGGAAVHFLDVGQGDAVLLEAGGEYALVDAGPADAADTLTDALNSLGVQGLRYLVMTHPHADHIGGMRAVVEGFSVQQVLLPDFDKAPLPTTSTFEKLLNAMQEKGLPAETMRAGAAYPLGAGSLNVLTDSLPTGDNYNLLSPILLFECGGLRYLSAGDAEKENETLALEQGLDLRADVYKASHHGSTTSNTPAFVTAVAPQLAVISCGAGNTYGHPHREVLELFEEQGCAVLRTDQNGSVRVALDEAGNLTVAAAVPPAEGQQAA